jgi:peptidoglycan/LPS O-acetylase OafA/YrhL
LLLALALLSGRSAPVSIAVLLLASIYVVPEGDRAVPAPIYGGTLLLIAELAFWSLDERASGWVEPGTAMPRLVGILAVVVTGVAAGALVMLASESDLTRSPATTAVGVGAILASIAVLATLAGSLIAPGSSRRQARSDR